MTEFNVGDQVQMIDDSGLDLYWAHIGMMGEVVKTDGPDWVQVIPKGEKSSIWYLSTRFKLAKIISTPTPEIILSTTEVRFSAQDARDLLKTYDKNQWEKELDGILETIRNRIESKQITSIQFGVDDWFSSTNSLNYCMDELKELGYIVRLKQYENGDCELSIVWAE